MSDSRLHELRRAWRSSGRVEDGTAYLREGLRTGELTPTQLRLAAFLGDPAAAVVSGAELLPAVTSSRRIHTAEGLHDLSGAAYALGIHWKRAWSSQGEPRFGGYVARFAGLAPDLEFLCFHLCVEDFSEADQALASNWLRERISPTVFDSLTCYTWLRGGVGTQVPIRDVPDVFAFVRLCVEHFDLGSP